jgi:hypothetical protein
VIAGILMLAETATTSAPAKLCGRRQQEDRGALTAQSLQHKNRRRRAEIWSTFQGAYFNRQCEFDPREVSQRLKVPGASSVGRGPCGRSPAARL